MAERSIRKGAAGAVKAVESKVGATVKSLRAASKSPAAEEVKSAVKSAAKSAAARVSAAADKVADRVAEKVVKTAAARVAKSAPAAKPRSFAQPKVVVEANIPQAYRVSDDAGEVWAEIRRLKLEPYIAELNTLGYTIIPPEVAAPAGFTDRLRNAILDVVERRAGFRPDMVNGLEFQNPAVPFGQNFAYLLFEDPVFQEAITAPVPAALVTYLLGENAVLSNCLAFLKGPGDDDLGLHSDNVYIPSPFPQHAQVCNVTWLLTDYSKADGALCFVPGSQSHCRHPEPGEAVNERVAVEARAGSIAFWHGNTWHGAFARTNKGARLNLINAYMRMHMRPQEPYRENVTPEILARNTPRFAKLVGQHIGYGWKEEGPDYKRLGMVGGGQHLWD